MQLSAEQIECNWKLFLENINTYFTGERKEILYTFYDKYADRFALMPASGKVSYHNAFAGGYVDHVNRVLKFSFEVRDIWEKVGAQVPEVEELAFVAINHDLGKFGDLDHEEYLVEEEDYWKKKGQVYKHNPEISFMKTSERSLFLLQQIGVPVTQNEYLGIKLHDGLYEDANKSYYVSFSEEYRLRSNLPYIVHQADLLATRVEHDGVVEKKVVKVTKSTNQPRVSLPASSPIRLGRVTVKPEPTLKTKDTLPPPAPKPKSKFSSLLNSI